jgi:hypothetical protein
MPAGEFWSVSLGPLAELQPMCERRAAAPSPSELCENEVGTTVVERSSSDPCHVDWTFDLQTTSM